VALKLSFVIQIPFPSNPSRGGNQNQRRAFQTYEFFVPEIVFQDRLFFTPVLFDLDSRNLRPADRRWYGMPATPTSYSTVRAAAQHFLGVNAGHA